LGFVSPQIKTAPELRSSSAALILNPAPPWHDERPVCSQDSELNSWIKSG
jgi:hypothetical protein